MGSDERVREEWRTIEEYPFYEVSSLGRVRSKDRAITRRNKQNVSLKGKMLSNKLIIRGICVSAYVTVFASITSMSIDL